MKKSILLGLSLFIVSSVFSADSYHVGDTLFVWAKSGLNVRSSPSTKASIVEKIPFGDQVVIAEWCDKAYYIKVAEIIEPPAYKDEVVGPFILKGQWVKITTATGKSGFIINQYILFQEPFDKTNAANALPNLAIIQSDTIFNENDNYNAEDIERTITTLYEDGIKAQLVISELAVDRRIEFPNLSMEEAFVMITSSWDDLSGYRIVRNWQHTVVLTDVDEVCYLSVRWVNGVVIVETGCSC